MVTLQSTVRQLKELSIRPSLSGALDVPDARRGELLSTLERQAAAPLFLGRAVAQAAIRPRRRREPVPFSATIDPGSLEGIEVLEGRFESTNERSLDAFLHPLEGIEQPRWEEPVLPWTAHSQSVEPFGERALGGQAREPAPVPSGLLKALELVSAVIEAIAEHKLEALRVHENTSERIVRGLTGSS